MREAITGDAEVMHGAPVFRGTRVPVRTMFEYLRELAVQVLEESKELRLARV